MDVKKLRKDFPILQKKVNGKPIIYMDSACMSLKPRQVVEAMNEYYYEYPACASRSSHRLGAKATEKYNGAREALAKFIGAKKSEEIIFTRNTTEGINLVANSLEFRKGDVVLTTDKEHNSNLLPWISRKGLQHKIVFSKSDGTFDMNAFERAMSRKVKLVSMVHTSNLDGYRIPAKEIIKTAHDHGALVLLDAAQSVPHRQIDVRKMDVDFIAFSGHKMLGPTGTGVLYGKYNLLEQMSPFMIGGDTVHSSTYTSFKLLDPPEKFEAGLQNYAGAVGMAAAAKYLEKVGVGTIEKHEIALNTLITKELRGIDGLNIIGPSAEQRSGIISFFVDEMNAHGIAVMLDETANIMVRSGQHCVHSWFNAHRIEGSARASLYLYNTEEEAKIFAETMKKITQLR